MARDIDAQGDRRSINLERLVSRFRELLEEHLGENLVSLILFGSVARGDYRPDSDVDLLLVCETLPSNRWQRWDPILAVEERLRKEFSSPGGLPLPYISVILKERREAAYHSPLYLDLTEDARILLDRGGFFEGVLEEIRLRLKELGSQRKFLGEGWYWDLKPDLKPGEVVEI
ncbi:MAG: nucleotidyltransferase domain-containing protein [Dehalococcoidia bacterium]|nr:nucleotidyltransferase domain-containing protein [Dehalococcoidia bacterium]